MVSHALFTYKNSLLFRKLHHHETYMQICVPLYTVPVGTTDVISTELVTSARTDKTETDLIGD